MSKSIQLFLFLALIFLTSCNNNQNSGKDAFNDTTTIKELTVKWNDCLVKQDLQTLKTLYAGKFASCMYFLIKDIFIRI